jgi:hypothetical protein
MKFSLLISFFTLSLAAAEIPAPGLMVDLDAAKGVTLDAQGRVTSWSNQVGPAVTRDFVGQPKGRTEPTSGLPTPGRRRRAFAIFSSAGIGLS